MKRTILALFLIYLSVSPVWAEEAGGKPQNGDLEDLAERLNVIKPQDYVEMSQPARDYAYRTAKKLTSKEIALINSAQKRLNRDLARRLEQKEQKPVMLDPTNTQQIEDFLTPPLLTYDNVQE